MCIKHTRILCILTYQRTPTASSLTPPTASSLTPPTASSLIPPTASSLTSPTASSLTSPTASSLTSPCPTLSFSSPSVCPRPSQRWPSCRGPVSRDCYETENGGTEDGLERKVGREGMVSVDSTKSGQQESVLKF